MKKELDQELCLIQINNIHGFKGGLRGAPLFDSCGRVVGRVNGIVHFTFVERTNSYHPKKLLAVEIAAIKTRHKRKEKKQL